MTATTPARYIMVGGFLGAGKSTAMGKLAAYLTAKDYRVGLIVNDQGRHLVDTLNLKQKGFAVEEIPGGCFCCRFNSLVEAADQLSKESTPDLFLAEPVGSCTDLIASVSYPLRRIYGERFTIAPLNVLVDPRRAAAILGLTQGKSFSEKVVYIYLKQMEEADQIVVNKIDLLSAQERRDLGEAIAARFPGKRVMFISARSGEGLEQWFESLMVNEQSSAIAMPMDYITYAEGEALLGWLNATVNITADRLFDGDAWLADLAQEVQQRLEKASVEVAHFKMTLEPSDGSGELAVINLVSTGYVAEMAQTLSDPLDRGQLIINLRAEGDPDTLTQAVTEALAAVDAPFLHLELDHQECFKPAPPQPQYRMDARGTALAI